jgi:hypothetical protein
MIPRKEINYSLHLGVHTGPRDLLASYTVGTGALSLWLRRPGCVAYYTPPSSAKVKMHGNMSPLPHTFMESDLFICTDNFTFQIMNCLFILMDEIYIVQELGC